MPKDKHNKAAEHHDAAAKAHRKWSVWGPQKRFRRSSILRAGQSLGARTGVLIDHKTFDSGLPGALIDHKNRYFRLKAAAKKRSSDSTSAGSATVSAIS